METIMMWTHILMGVSTLALLGLLYIYAKNLQQVKSKFTAGLFIFALLFLLQNAVSLYYYITMMQFYVDDVAVHVFVLTLLQTVAFVLMLKISWE